MSDPVYKPAHYISGGIESLDIIEAFNLNFSRGNAIKYTLRAGRKDPTKEIEDLKKAIFYLQREVDRLQR